MPPLDGLVMAFSFEKLPREPPRVEAGNYNVGMHVIKLEDKMVLVNGAWESLKALDLTSRNADFTWLSRALRQNGRPDMRHLLAKLPIMDEMRKARLDAGGTGRRQRALASQVLDITVRDYNLQVDKYLKKFIVYVKGAEDLQFLVSQILKDFLEIESVGGFSEHSDVGEAHGQ